MNTLVNVLVRPATVDDIFSIQHVAHQSWPVTFGDILTPEQLAFELEAHYSPASLHHQMTNGHQFLLLFESPDVQEPSGFVSWSIESSYVKIHKLYLLPDTKGLGFGRHLMMAVESVVRQSLSQPEKYPELAGVNELRLNVNRQNDAKTFYEHLGYRVLYEEDLPSGDFLREDYVMGKPLAVVGASR